MRSRSLITGLLSLFTLCTAGVAQADWAYPSPMYYPSFRERPKSTRDDCKVPAAPRLCGHVILYPVCITLADDSRHWQIPSCPRVSSPQPFDPSVYPSTPVYEWDPPLSSSFSYHDLTPVTDGCPPSACAVRPAVACADGTLAFPLCERYSDGVCRSTAAQCPTMATSPSSRVLQSLMRYPYVCPTISAQGGAGCRRVCTQSESDICPICSWQCPTRAAPWRP